MGFFFLENLLCFNTQPPEGGCPRGKIPRGAITEFQHTAARRRLREKVFTVTPSIIVSTHSRPKAAAPVISFSYRDLL